MQDCMMDDTQKYNLQNLYKIGNIPSDTHLRLRLDNIDTERLQYGFDTLISQMQRGRIAV